MAVLIPDFNFCLPRMTSGEKRFARRIEDNLEIDYLCWYDVPIGWKKLYPDFIILHPLRGILILEVKDWKLEYIKHVTPVTVTLMTVNGPVKNKKRLWGMFTYSFGKALTMFTIKLNEARSRATVALYNSVKS